MMLSLLQAPRAPKMNHKSVYVRAIFIRDIFIIFKDNKDNNKIIIVNNNNNKGIFIKIILL